MARNPNVLSRRRAMACLLATAGMAVADVLGQSIARRDLKLGLVTYNWGKDWDLPTLIRYCAETGFGGVELRSTHRHGVEIDLNPSARQSVKERFRDSPVTLVGLGSACEFHAPDQAVLNKNMEEAKAFVKLCHDVGGSGVKVRPNGLPPDVPVEKTLAQIGRSLNVLGSFAADYGIQIRVEVHGKGTQQIPTMKTIMEVADHANVVVCWNCNPSDLEGAGFEPNFRMIEPRMGTIHIHDLRPGKNDYPWEQLFPLLSACQSPGFTGWCLLEEGAMPADAAEAMRENRRRFDELVSA
ncbi:MAG: sugar phosphate isomerase/epimerase family protein [Planctomycetaceae bacterium]